MECIKKKNMYIYIFIYFICYMFMYSMFMYKYMFIKDSSSLVQPRTIHSRNLKLNNCSHITKTDPTTIKI